jgi:hypothetical protein
LNNNIAIAPFLSVFKSGSPRRKKTDKTWVASKINNYKEKKKDHREAFIFYFLFLMDAKQRKKTQRASSSKRFVSEDDQIWTSLEVSRL